MVIRRNRQVLPWLPRRMTGNIRRKGSPSAIDFK
jgi:hypothetical protein